MRMMRLSCLQHSLKNFKTGVDSHYTIDFTVDGYVDADEDVVTSETHLLSDSEIIARGTQTQLAAAEHHDENEDDDVDQEMTPPRRDQVRQAIELFTRAVFTKITESRRCRKKW